jgi:hypothetical protein
MEASVEPAESWLLCRRLLGHSLERTLKGFWRFVGADFSGRVNESLGGYE